MGQATVFPDFDLVLSIGPNAVRNAFFQDDVGIFFGRQDGEAVWESGHIFWDSAIPAFIISSEAAGGGTVRDMILRSGGAEIIIQGTAGTEFGRFPEIGVLQFEDGVAAAVSGAANGRIRYNNAGTGTWQVSTQGGAYVDIATGTGSAFVQGGNSFGANAVLGTNDVFPLIFETSGVDAGRFLATGGLVVGGSAFPLAGGVIAALGDSAGSIHSTVRNTNVSGEAVFSAHSDGAVATVVAQFGITGSANAGFAGIVANESFMIANSGTVGLALASGTAPTPLPTRFINGGTESARFTTGNHFLVGLTTVVNSARDIADFEKNQNNRSTIRILNTTAGTLAQPILTVQADTTALEFGCTSSAFTPIRGLLADEAVWESFSGGIAIAAGGATAMRFLTNAVERMRILSGGTIHMGTEFTVFDAAFVLEIEDSTANAARGIGIINLNSGNAASAELITRAQSISFTLQSTSSTHLATAGREANSNVLTAAVGQMIIQTTSNQPIKFKTGVGFSERMSILLSSPPTLQGNGSLTVQGGVGVTTLTLSGGTGAASTVAIQGAATDLIGMYGIAAVAQHSTTGQTAGFTAGVGSAVLDDSTFTGGTGATAYTIGDMVRALKLIGLMAA